MGGPLDGLRRWPFAVPIFAVAVKAAFTARFGLRSQLGVQCPSLTLACRTTYGNAEDLSLPGMRR